MIDRDEPEFSLVADMASKMAEELFFNQSPIGWVAGEDGELRPKGYDEFDFQGLCFRALAKKHEEALGIDFVYSSIDFRDAFLNSWWFWTV